ncbi:MAG: carbohydrate-binding protein [Syntrophomonadales bacterium]
MSRVEMNGGITAEPYPAGVGDQVNIRYTGLLAQSGADKVFMHVGYGDKWEDRNDYEMRHTDQGWEAQIRVHRGGQLNFCFKDRADNWDNNKGFNWTYQIDSKRFRQ